MVTKDKLILDTANLTESDNVGAYVRASDGTLITHTTVAGKDALDVYIVNNAASPALTRDASDYAEDSAHVSGDIGSFALAVRHDANTSLVDTDGDYAPLQVDATGRLKVDAIFDPTFDFVYPEDSGHVSGDPGAFVLAVRNDTNAVLTSTDLDYSAIAVDSAGRVKITGTITATSNAEKAEDSASANADIGDFVLAVRQDTLASSVSADGDYAAFKLNSRGGLWTIPVGTVADDAADTENPVKMGSRARIGALAAISTDGDRADALSDRYRRLYVNSGPNVSALNTAVTVGVAAASLLGAELSGRRRYLIQNLGTRAIFLGNDATVTVANGFRIAAGANMDVELGEDVALFAIATLAGQDVRILELA